MASEHADLFANLQFQLSLIRLASVSMEGKAVDEPLPETAEMAEILATVHRRSGAL